MILIIPNNTMLFCAEIINSLLRLLRNERFRHSTETALQLTMYCNGELELSQIQSNHSYFERIKAKIKSLMNNIYGHVNNKAQFTYIQDAYHLVFVYEFPYGINGPCHDYYYHGQVLDINLIDMDTDNIRIHQNLISFILDG